MSSTLKYAILIALVLLLATIPLHGPHRRRNHRHTRTDREGFGRSTEYHEWCRFSGPGGRYDLAKPGVFLSHIEPPESASSNQE